MPVSNGHIFKEEEEISSAADGGRLVLYLTRE
jgi:hypothetical protein